MKKSVLNIIVTIGLFLFIIGLSSQEQINNDVEVREVILMDSGFSCNILHYRFMIDPPILLIDTLLIEQVILNHDAVKNKNYITGEHAFLHYFNSKILEDNDFILKYERLSTLWIYPDGQLKLFYSDHFPIIDTLCE